MALAMVLSTLAGGCATPERMAGKADWTTGRLSLRIDASPDRSAQSMSAAFELRTERDAGELRLNSPLGTRVATARWSGSDATLTTSGAEQRFANLAELSREALGEALPLAALPDWMAGRPWPGAPSRPDESGFEQLGWQVRLDRFAQGAIDIRREAPPAVRMQVRLDDPS